MGPAVAPWAEAARALYRQGDLLLQCPFSLPMPWGVPSLPLGLTAAQPRGEREELRKRLALPPDRSRCVLVCFGGLGKSIDPALLRRWPEHVLIGPDPALAEEVNGRVLPEGLRPLDLLPLCARLITKPGYSSFCEALSQGVGIHLVRRSGFAEAPVLEAELQRHGWHRLLTVEAFDRGDWQLDQPLLPPREGGLPLDGAQVAAEALLQVAAARSAVPINGSAVV
jgi:hypothetical protein